ncbi:hypothetical protein TCAL_08124 [Tigriopus californicus]|uniref:CCD97-like C-terminal domain-containing protein n=1 Tax=Tigriopus californicus TaxID=6832 RepID=A0A553PLH4_TIGCA|nr:coiled-coil domain-containing protein 97-like [Tigriopus californicus]TRY78512.1 hypothetical protein TCAL_08124 [Tigriopus californicus]|eukprot:TCALIF_08124-PA protein Name:"Protein of unknown function" AED:0.16 eAED:0.16 QI:0/-1/0/1/-1/1/1/0/221
MDPVGPPVPMWGELPERTPVRPTPAPQPALRPVVTAPGSDPKPSGRPAQATERASNRTVDPASGPLDPARPNRNRRYRWMQSQLAQADAYFSTQAMRQRHPGLWAQICGPDLSWPPPPPDGTDGRWSSLILDQWDRNQARDSAQAHTVEEFDSEDEDGLDHPPTDPAARTRLTAEFRQLVCQQFLNGGEPDFDYARVDHDPTWDDWDQLDRDAQEAYFDAD